MGPLGPPAPSFSIVFLFFFFVVPGSGALPEGVEWREAADGGVGGVVGGVGWYSEREKDIEGH